MRRLDRADSDMIEKVVSTKKKDKKRAVTFNWESDNRDMENKYTKEEVEERWILMIDSYVTEFDS